MQRLRSILAISLIPVTLPIASTEAATVVSVDVVRVIDGDTLVIAFDDSLRKLRLLGIDAPEYDQDGGMAPVDHLKLGWGAKFGPEGSSIIGSPSGNPE